MTNRFYAIDPAGQRHTRTSKGRTYTHVVLRFNGGQAQYEADVSKAKAEYTPANQLKTWTAYKDWSEGRNDAGQIAHMARQGLPVRPLSDSLRKAGVDFMAAYPTVEAYASRCLADKLEVIEQTKAGGWYDKYTYVGWCGRLDLAQSLAKPGDLILEALKA